jgi:LacI family transcriptional regulator
MRKGVASVTSAVQHATLTDVARRAGVGTTTVSRVINGGTRVSAETLATVLRAIDELGFVPNLAAQMLKGEQSKTIGLILPSIADPFFASCAEAIQTVAGSYGSMVLVTVTHNDPLTELENIKALYRRIDGLLIAPSTPASQNLIATLVSFSKPVVCFDRPLPDDRVPAVLTDNYYSTKLAVQHLLKHGYEQILCFGGESQFYTASERIRGYRSAMRSAGKPAELDVAIHKRSAEEVTAALTGRLKRKTPPRAVFCLNNTTTIHTYDALQTLGISVPDRVALAGYDDFVLAATLRPSITVVQQPVEEIGRFAAKLLFDKLRMMNSTSPQSFKLLNTTQVKSKLIVRASCGCKEITQLSSR